jgi:hypothetical protein
MLMRFAFIRFAAAFSCLLLILSNHTSAQAAGPVFVPDTPPSLRIAAPKNSTRAIAIPATATPPIVTPPIVKSAAEQQAKRSAPQFKSRVWHNTLGQPIANGKAMGISKDVIWLRTLRGAVIRRKLSELHPQDRKHALKKRQAILEFRQHAKQVSS